MQRNLSRLAISCLLCSRQTAIVGHLCAQEDDRRDGRWASGPAWVSSEWQATEAGAVQILPYGLDGHQVRDVVSSMQLQRIVLLTDRIEVSHSFLVGPCWGNVVIPFGDALPAL